MARRSLAAKRYAEAVASLAGPSGTWDAWIRDLATVADALDEPTIRPSLSDPNRAAAIARSLEGGEVVDDLRPETLRLLRVMAERRTLGLVGDTVAWLRDLADSAAGVRRVTVTTAFPLDGELQRQVQEHVAGTPGDAGKVVLTLEVDPDILGGVVIREGDQISDRSVRARLEGLRELMS